ncbi:hypothetical protein BKA69DRAFT_1040286 [Paraphysoderma sedebokerense]|nr:hypothetical protein BKA69DRAFT_1040286 [Paraphysoderma sedebokerense]
MKLSYLSTALSGATLFASIAILATILIQPSRFSNYISKKSVFIPTSSIIPDFISSGLRSHSSDQYALLEFFIRDAFNWDISTTPIPISTPSVLLKEILSKNVDAIPPELQYLIHYDTVDIRIVRDYFSAKRHQKLLELCSRIDCRSLVNIADPEFNMTPLHYAYAQGYDETIQYLKSLGANEDAMDSVSRKPGNLSFSGFVKNSRKWAKQANRDCELPVVSMTRKEDFKEVKRLVGEGEPVLIRNGLKYLENNPGRGDSIVDTNIEEVIQKYGDYKVSIGEVPYSDYFNLSTHIDTLSSFYRQEVIPHLTSAMPKPTTRHPLYIFQKHPEITSRALSILDTLVKVGFPSPNLICPASFAKTGSDSIHFFLGAPGRGAPFHIHADAINLNIHGNKQWFIYPPLESVYSRKHISRFISQDLAVSGAENEGMIEKGKWANPAPRVRPLTCIQRPGDIVYIPFDWAHAVLNKDLNMGFALELLNRRETGAALPIDGLYRKCT